jgi:Na+/H+ antiporter NhaD/arsenite permease-like protein
MTTNDTQKKSAQQWVLPGFAVAIGIAYLIAGLVGDEVGFGLFGLALMVTVAVALLLVRRRSETVQGLLDRRDERIVQIDIKATAFAGSVVIAAVLIAFIVEIARGHGGSPYAALGAIGGLAYLASVVWHRVRG